MKSKDCGVKSIGYWRVKSIGYWRVKSIGDRFSNPLGGFENKKIAKLFSTLFSKIFKKISWKIFEDIFNRYLQSDIPPHCSSIFCIISLGVK